MTNYKKILFFILMPLSLALLFVLNTQDKNLKEHKRVVVSSFFLYDIVSHIAGNDLDIVNILPFGMDPHSFELSPKQMGTIQKSDLVFYTGAGLEPWVEKIEFTPRAVDVSSVASLFSLTQEEENHHKHKSEDHHSTDPHYWLDFQNMKNAVALISQELIKLEPENTQKYIQNTQAYIRMLTDLQALYTKSLKSCKRDTIVINHNFFGYVSRAYHFQVESLSGLSLESQPSPSDLVRVLSSIKETNVTTLFLENFANTKVLKSIAKDTGVKVEVLEPLANITHSEAIAHVTYKELMKSNLRKLTEALSCQ